MKNIWYMALALAVAGCSSTAWHETPREQRMTDELEVLRDENPLLRSYIDARLKKDDSATRQAVQAISPQEAERLLHLAAISGDLATVQLLLKQRVNPNTKDDQGETPLYHACQNEHTEVVRTLLNGGADPNSRDMDGETALFDTCVLGNTEIAALLLSHGAQVNATDEENETALFPAVQSGNKELITLLLKNGATIRPNVESLTPLDLTQNKSILDILRQSPPTH